MRKVDGIKVLMMGARRAGKTSMLAGLVDTFMNDSVRQYIHVGDKSSGNDTAALLEKTKTLSKFIQNNEKRIVLVDEGSTNSFQDYVLSVTLPGNSGESKMIFTDANGEFYANGYANTEEIKQKIKEYDVILIAIDTPYLMESANPNNTLCMSSTNRAYNQIDNVHTLLGQIDDANGQDAKLVLFVPIKCEYWAQRNELDKVAERVKQCYSATISALTAFKMVEVAIVPVQTVGSIVYDCQREAKVLNSIGGTNIKCSEMSDDRVRLYDGTVRPLNASDNIADDMDAVIEGFNITRPNTWFRVISDKYEPKNCEQLAFFILHYMLCKTMTAYNREKGAKSGKGSSTSWLTYAASACAMFGQYWLAAGILAYAYLSNKMGSIDQKALQNTIDKIRTNGLWKISSDGITVLNKAFL